MLRWERVSLFLAVYADPFLSLQTEKASTEQRGDDCAGNTPFSPKKILFFHHLAGRFQRDYSNSSYALLAQGILYFHYG